MTAGLRLNGFFGEDWEDALGSLVSAPGAFGNLVLASARQVRAIDAAAFGLVLAGWAWAIVGQLILGEGDNLTILVSLLPTVLWLAAGIAGGLVFEIGGFGPRVLAYWESYVLILLFALFGLISLRLALNPKDRHIYRGGPTAPSGL
jgi:hypothetical protein